MNTLVSFELARLLKEKGFDLPAQKYYEYALKSKKHKEDGYSGPFGWEKGELNLQKGYFVNNNKISDFTSKMWYMCSAPTIADVVMWFYEKYKIWISVEWENHEFRCILYDANPLTSRYNNVYSILSGFHSPTKSYEAAIEYCLTKII